MRDIRVYEDMVEVIKWLKTQPHPFKTIVVDTFSELVKKDHDFIIKKKIEQGGKNRDRDLDEIHLDDYSRSLQHMRRVARELLDMPCHVIFITHSKQKDVDGTIMTIPNLFDSLGVSLQAMVDVVGYYLLRPQEKEEGGKKITVTNRLLVTEGRGRFWAKDRSAGGLLRGVMVNPTMTDIYSKLYRKEESNV
jgi:hypothetical protein